jgi:adenylate cyclase
MTAKATGEDVKLQTLDNLTDKYLAAAYDERKKRKVNTFEYTYNGENYIAQFIKIKSEFISDWEFLAVAPVDVFIGSVKKAQLQVMLICIGILLLSTFLISYLTLRISSPINSLVKQAERIRVFDLSDIPTVQSGIVEIQKLQDSIYRMRKSLEAFGKFVPKNLVRSLVDKETEVKIGGKKKRLTILFSDIEGFTSISENAAPDKLMLHLSEYFDELSRIVLKEHGTIDKYIGDSIMAFWGAPQIDVKHSLNACQAALFCQKKLTYLNRKWIYDKKPALNTRIGIHTGDVIVGNLGSSERMNYTVIGDSANLASRLEGVNKQYGTKIIISETVYKEIHENAIVRPLDIVSVKGKNQGIAIYELIALTGVDPYLLPTSDELDMCSLFQEGFKHYYEQRWDEALEVFDHLSLRFPADLPTRMYIERCKYFKENPPGKHWDHIHKIKDK